MQQQQDRWEPDMRARQGMVDRYEINVRGEVYGGMRERWCYMSFAVSRCSRTMASFTALSVYAVCFLSTAVV